MRAHLLGSLINALGPRPHLLSQPGSIRMAVGGRVVDFGENIPRCFCYAALPLLSCPLATPLQRGTLPASDQSQVDEVAVTVRHAAGQPGSSADSLTRLAQILETGFQRPVSSGPSVLQPGKH